LVERAIILQQEFEIRILKTLATILAGARGRSSRHPSRAYIFKTGLQNDEQPQGQAIRGKA
jgi:hypothetical protein